MNGLIVKPIHSAELFEAIESCIDLEWVIGEPDKERTNLDLDAKVDAPPDEIIQDLINQAEDGSLVPSKKWASEPSNLVTFRTSKIVGQLAGLEDLSLVEYLTS